MSAPDVHQAAQLFPLMDAADFSALVADIRAHGLLEPIILLDGQVLDGRNRLAACTEAGVEPTFTDLDANGVSPVEFVVSKNLHRRHLTTPQRAALALDLLPHLEAEARERSLANLKRGTEFPERPEADGRADERAAEIVGVGRSTVAAVKAISQRDPEVVERMRAGAIPTVAAAAREAGFRGLAQMRTPVLAVTKRDVKGREQPAVQFGRGDKFDDALEPMRRYLRAWGKRDFQFKHVNPKEARRRLSLLDDIAHGLEQVRRDLEGRSETARLTL